jgi:hypothetical protein
MPFNFIIFSELHVYTHTRTHTAVPPPPTPKGGKRYAEEEALCSSRRRRGEQTDNSTKTKKIKIPKSQNAG